MNIQRLKTQAERLENWDDKTYGRRFNFNQWVIVDEFNIISCDIAGDIALSYSTEEFSLKYGNRYFVFRFAQDYLDLTGRQADWLFLGQFIGDACEDGESLAKITTKDAAKAIRLLVEHGDLALNMMI